MAACTHLAASLFLFASLGSLVPAQYIVTNNNSIVMQVGAAQFKLTSDSDSCANAAMRGPVSVAYLSDVYQATNATNAQVPSMMRFFFCRFLCHHCLSISRKLNSCLWLKIFRFLHHLTYETDPISF